MQEKDLNPIEPMTSGMLPKNWYIKQGQAIKKRQIYLDLFRKYDIKAVLAGHLRQNSLAADPQFEIVTTSPVGMPLGEAFSGFRVVKVYADHIEHKYFGLDDVINLDF